MAEMSPVARNKEVHIRRNGCCQNRTILFHQLNMVRHKCLIGVADDPSLREQLIEPQLLPGQNNVTAHFFDRIRTSGGD